MKIGLVGLGKMGGDMVKRLTERDHEVVGFDVDDDVVREATSGPGAEGAGSLEDLVERLEPPRAVWVMVPHGKPTTETLGTLIRLLEPDDILVDGGNSRFTDSTSMAARASEHGVHFIDAGVSGGVWGRKEGYCVMVGGSEAACERMEPIFTALAPEGGYARVGASGAGHFVKMVHNAIEYAQLQALGEGFHCLSDSDFDLDLVEIARLWQHGAVVRSWLLGLLGDALEEDGQELSDVGAYVDDSGMGRWSVDYAVSRGIPVPAITTALYERFSSRLPHRYSAKVIAALRNQFGGHAVHEAAS